MSLKVSESSTYEPLEPGEYLGVCYKIVDMGERIETYQNESNKRKSLFITWELPNKLGSDGRPYSISKKYTASLNEAANLYKDITNWRGKPFTAEEKKGFDVSKLIGAPANLHIGMNKNGDKNVVSAIFRPEEFKITETINPAQIFDLDVYLDFVKGEVNEETKNAAEVFDGLVSWMQQDIQTSFEYLAVEEQLAKEPKATTNSGLSDLVKEDKEDDIEIPF